MNPHYHGERWTNDDLVKVFKIVTLMAGPLSTWTHVTRPYDDPAKNKDFVERVYPAIGALFGRTGDAIEWWVGWAQSPTERTRRIESVVQRRACLCALHGGFLTVDQYNDFNIPRKIKVA